MKKGLSMIGTIAVGAAVLLALLSYFQVFAQPAIVGLFLAIAGVYLGFTAIKGAENVSFMIAALVIAGGTAALAILPLVGGLLQAVFANLLLIVAPAALVIAGMVVYKSVK